MPDFVKGDALADVPADMVSDIQANYSPGSVGAVTVQGKVWGYPTEVATYQLLYNKKMFAEAGLTEPPKTFAELKDYACKLTKGRECGWHPGPHRICAHARLGLGRRASVPFDAVVRWWRIPGSRSLQVQFNSPKGQETLQLINDMIADGCVDPGLGGGNTDFVTGKSAMIIMANWLRATFQASSSMAMKMLVLLPSQWVPTALSRLPCSTTGYGRWIRPARTRQRPGSWSNG